MNVSLFSSVKGLSVQVSKCGSIAQFTKTTNVNIFAKVPHTLLQCVCKVSQSANKFLGEISEVTCQSQNGVIFGECSTEVAALCRNMLQFRRLHHFSVSLFCFSQRHKEHQGKSGHFKSFVYFVPSCE